MKSSKTQAEPAARETHQKQLIARLRRVEGQLRGIQAMISAEADCEAVAQQVAAARRALDRTFYEIIACALESELGTAATPSAARAAGIEVSRILAKYG